MDKPVEAIWRVYVQRCTRGDKKWCRVTELYIPHAGVLTYVHHSYRFKWLAAWLAMGVSDPKLGWFFMTGLNWHEINRGL